MAWALIAVFTLLPHLRIGGKPAILLDIGRRHFILFGSTFLPTDTVLLALLAIGAVVAVFLVTALLGRIWCGWACPQTVYLEFVYRPIERFFDGAPGRGGAPGKRRTLPRTMAKHLLFLLISMFLAHTFLAYFVGVDVLRQWMLRSPFEHPTPFIVMAVTTALMMFDFAVFREQTCIVACPYGRLQSVLIDRDSLIISYDPRRGEPRRKRGPAAAAEGRAEGDCVDCGLCVETCPTGIDIRDGLRMECIGCAQCIDACDAVMAKVGRPKGLIRYSSQARIAGEGGRLARPRVFIYPLILLTVAAAFSVALARRQGADVSVLRGLGAPFVQLSTGEVSNLVRLKITNRNETEGTYRVEIVGVAGPSARLIIEEDPIRVAPGESATKAISIIAPASAFQGGACEIKLRVHDQGPFSRELSWRLLGPAGPAAPAALPAAPTAPAGAGPR